MKRRKFILQGSLVSASLGIAGCKNKGPFAPGEGDHVKSPIPPKYTSMKPARGGPVLGANEKIVLALIGAGGWGTRHAIELAQMKENIEFKYICEVDDTRGGRAIAEIEKLQGFKPQRVRDMRNALDDKEVDAVIVVTPEHWHTLAAVWACQAGKDVYVEKCVSHNLTEGQKLAEASIKYDRIVQSGLQNRSASYVAEARDYASSGKLGKIVHVTVDEFLPGPIPFNEKEDEKMPETLDWDLWLGPAPSVPYNISRHKSWYYYWDYGGGNALTNDSIHQLDMTRMILGDPGMPRSVITFGGRTLFDDSREIPDFQAITCDYGAFQIHLRAGEFAPYMQKASNQVRYSDNLYPNWDTLCTKVTIYGTEGRMLVGRMGGGWQVFGDDGSLVAQQTGVFPLQDHMHNFLDCVRTRNSPNGDIIQAHLSSALLHYANISHRLDSEKLTIDDRTERTLNSKEATALEDGSYRPGFEIVV